MAGETTIIKSYGIIREVRNAPGTGQDAYLYIGYADDDQGAGFTSTFDATKNYIAFLPTTEPIEVLEAAHFTGLWKQYGSGIAVEEAATRSAITAATNRRFIIISEDENNEGARTFAFHTGTEIINIATT